MTKMRFYEISVEEVTDTIKGAILNPNGHERGRSNFCEMSGRKEVYSISFRVYGSFLEPQYYLISLEVTSLFTLTHKISKLCFRCVGGLDPLAVLPWQNEYFYSYVQILLPRLQ